MLSEQADCVFVSKVVLHKKKVICIAGAAMSLIVIHHPVTNTALWALAEPFRYQPFSCRWPYVSAISVSKIPSTTTTAGCLQNFKLL